MINYFYKIVILHYEMWSCFIPNYFETLVKTLRYWNFAWTTFPFFVVLETLN